MSLIPEVVQKIKDDLVLFGECVVERVQELLPDLSPEEQQNTPVLMVDTALATYMTLAPRWYTVPGVVTYQGDGCIFIGTFNINNNKIDLTIDRYIGVNNAVVNTLGDKDTILANANSNNFKITLDNPGTVYASVGTTLIEPRLYYNGAYHDGDIRMKWATPDCQQVSVQYPRVSTGTSAIDSYSVGADEVVTWTPSRNIKVDGNNPVLYSLKGYPFIGNVKNISNVNNWINNNGATNNYTTTHTTPQGKNINVYYGDNYIITHIENDEPVSYNDLKYALDIAVDQINDDNDTDIPHVPDYPIPAPPDIDDDIEVEMDLNDAAYGAGMSHYYVTTATSGVLDDISAAMSTWNINNTGKDLYRNLLSCRLTKVGPIPAENSTFVIYGEELQYNGAPISINKITGNPSMDLGEYEILPKFNDFRDYAPYTKIEMYIPYCGWVALPSHCMSSEDKPKIITGTLLCDIIAGTCKAVIKCNDTVVAEAAGFTAVDVPFVGENVGMKMAGIASSITSYGSNAAKTVGGIAGGMSGGGPAGAAAAGGVVSLLGSYAQLNAAFNANYTEICGKTGDGCNVAGLNKVYIKIQRPKTGGYEEPDFVPGDYGHTTGFLCMQKMKVSDCSGLIIASNADVSGIGSATDAERAEIKRVLETGLFVNSPPESGE